MNDKLTQTEEDLMNILAEAIPKSLVTPSKHLSTIIEKAICTLGRARKEGRGIPYLQASKGKMVVYPLREIVHWELNIRYDQDELTRLHLEDIMLLFPTKNYLDKNQLAQIKNVSLSTINRELSEEKDRRREDHGSPIGVMYIERDGKIIYPILDVAKWLSNTIKTY